MYLYIIIGIGAFTLGLAVGGFWFWKLGRKRFDEQTAVQVIENLKATIEVYRITHEEQMTYLGQKYTELKMDVMRLTEENKVLEEQIEKLKK